MRLSLTFLFIIVLSVCFAAGQRESGSATAQNAAADQQITNGPVAEYVSDSNCTIGWSARTSGTMTLRYGTDPAKLTKTAEATESKEGRNYHAQLVGLTPNTRYYFRVLNGSEAIGGVGTFQTVAQNQAPIRSKAVIPQ